jgi:APA family basic amino acid/polyamine antiporter
MAADGTFFKELAWINPRTHAPVVAIVAQGFVALVISFLPYERILNYVTCIDYIFFGFSAIALIVFRNRDAREPSAPRPVFRMPGHPVTTLLFLAVAWGVVGDVMLMSPETIIGVAILLSGLPVYWLFTRRARATRPIEAVDDLGQ